jgi:hypothetical protein
MPDIADVEIELKDKIHFIKSRIKRAGGNSNTKEWVFLGAGSYGEAYSIGNGLAIKITSSQREVQQAKSLKGKKYKHIYRIIDVFEYSADKVIVNCSFYNCQKENCETHRVQYKLYYGFIITPKYNKLNNKEKQSLSNLLQWFHPYSDIKSWADVRKECEQSYTYALKTKMGKKLLKRIKKFNLDKMAYNMGEARIYEADVHCNNILKNKSGSFVLIDLTC